MLDELSSQQALDLAAILIGDVTLRVDMVDEAKYYADAGAAVYVGYFDMSGSGGLRLIYTFFPMKNCGC